MAETVKILVQAFPGSNKVKLLTSNARIRPKIVKINSSAELFAEFRMYKKWVITENDVHVDVTMPNVFRAFLESRVLPPPPVIKVKFCSICGKQITSDDDININRAAHKRCASEESTFQVNMVEPLVGWKGWGVSMDTKLLSSTHSTCWSPGKAVEARCPDGICDVSPTEKCGCGIYAADNLAGANQGPGFIRGQIYGWGRYIRGGLGWRAEFAYPKMFLIDKDQMEHFEMLKVYGVPIYVQEPLMIYNPVDDGYEGEDNGNWEDAENRGGGTNQESDTEED